MDTVIEGLLYPRMALPLMLPLTSRAPRINQISASCTLNCFLTVGSHHERVLAITMAWGSHRLQCDTVVCVSVIGFFLNKKVFVGNKKRPYNLFLLTVLTYGLIWISERKQVTWETWIASPCIYMILLCMGFPFCNKKFGLILVSLCMTMNSIN